MNIFTGFFAVFRKTPPKPRELVCVSYMKADRMLRENVGWRLAPEEDRNREQDRVWLERDAPTVGAPRE